MILPFEYKEKIPEGNFSESTLSLNIEKNSAAKLILLRGIIGSISITHTLTQTTFDQSLDYLDLKGKYVGVSPIERLRNYISNNEITTDDLGDIFREKKFLFQNKRFYEILNTEFSNYYYYNNKESYTTAFAYLYRILETISYSFPLIYASRATDFIGTYNFLKDWMTGDKKAGELGFFKKFIVTTFSNDPAIAKDSSINIDIEGESTEIQQYFFDAFKKACNNPSIFAQDTQEPIRLSVKFTEYSSFIINLRNRFFHLLNSGQPNLQSDDILDSDHFFKMVNKPTAYWLSIILIQVLKHNIPESSN
jgi:hypothetical protein